MRFSAIIAIVEEEIKGNELEVEHAPHSSTNTWHHTDYGECDRLRQVVIRNEP